MGADLNGQWRTRGREKLVLIKLKEGRFFNFINITRIHMYRNIYILFYKKYGFDFSIIDMSLIVLNIFSEGTNQTQLKS